MRFRRRLRAIGRYIPNGSITYGIPCEGAKSEARPQINRFHALVFCSSARTRGLDGCREGNCPFRTKVRSEYGDSVSPFRELPGNRQYLSGAATLGQVRMIGL